MPLLTEEQRQRVIEKGYDPDRVERDLYRISMSSKKTTPEDRYLLTANFVSPRLPNTTSPLRDMAEAIPNALLGVGEAFATAPIKGLAALAGNRGLRTGAALSLPFLQPFVAAAEVAESQGKDASKAMYALSDIISDVVDGWKAKPSKAARSPLNVYNPSTKEWFEGANANNVAYAAANGLTSMAAFILSGKIAGSWTGASKYVQAGGKAALGADIGAMLGGYVYMNNELYNEFRNSGLEANEANKLASVAALPIALSEYVGINYLGKIFSEPAKKAIVKQTVKSTVKKYAAEGFKREMLEDMTVATVKGVSNRLALAGSRMAEGMLVEGSEEYVQGKMQQLSEMFYDRAKGEEHFGTDPFSQQAIKEDINNAFWGAAIGGLIGGGGGAINSKVMEQSMFNYVATNINKPQRIESLKQQILKQAQVGSLTQEEAKRGVELVDNMVAINTEEMPKSLTDSGARYQAYEFIGKRNEMQSVLDELNSGTVDPVLSEADDTRRGMLADGIALYNEGISSIATTKAPINYDFINNGLKQIAEKYAPKQEEQQDEEVQNQPTEDTEQPQTEGQEQTGQEGNEEEVAEGEQPQPQAGEQPQVQMPEQPSLEAQRDAAIAAIADADAEIARLSTGRGKKAKTELEQMRERKRQAEDDLARIEAEIKGGEQVQPQAQSQAEQPKYTEEQAKEAEQIQQERQGLEEQKSVITGLIESTRGAIESLTQSIQELSTKSSDKYGKQLKRQQERLQEAEQDLEDYGQELSSIEAGITTLDEREGALREKAKGSLQTNQGTDEAVAEEEDKKKKAEEIEETVKALSEADKTKWNSVSKLSPLKSGAYKERSDLHEAIAKAYHKAKADNSNPEFVAAVEEVLEESKPAAAKTKKKGKPDGYYIKDGGEFVKVDNARPVTLNVDGDFFAVKGENGFYTIYEGTSGAVIVRGGKLLRDAIKSANEVIERNAKAGFTIEQAIEGEIRRGGKSPRYAEQSQADSEAAKPALPTLSDRERQLFLMGDTKKSLGKPLEYKASRATKETDATIFYNNIVDFAKDIGVYDGAFKPIWDYLDDKKIQVEFRKNLRGRGALGRYRARMIGGVSFDRKVVLEGQRFTLSTLMHESIHAVLDVSGMAYNPAIIAKMRKLQRDIKIFAAQNPDVITQAYGDSPSEKRRAEFYLNVITSAGADQWQEVVTYALTEPDFALFMQRMPSLQAGNSNRVDVTLWDRLLNIIIDFVGDVTGLKRSALDDLTDILNSAPGVGSLAISRMSNQVEMFNRVPSGRNSERRQIENKAKKDGSWLMAPNGQPSNLSGKDWVTVRTQAFKDWFGDWEGNPENASKVVDENGEPLAVYHGTTKNIEAFDKSKAAVESNLGAGFYFTSSFEDMDANYHGGGADLENKVDRRIEELANFFYDDGDGFREAFPEYSNISYENAETMFEMIARGEYAVGNEVMYTVFLNMRNPVILDGKNSGTFIEGEYSYDEDSGMEEMGGTLMDIHDAIQEAASEYSDVDQQAVSNLLNDIIEATADGGMYASDLERDIKEAFSYAVDYDIDGTPVMATEIFRSIMEKVGFDGFIDKTVYQKFGRLRAFGQPMAGIERDTAHYIAFEPNQIKSNDNTGAFSSEDDRIMYNLAFDEEFNRALPERIRSLKIKTGGRMFDATIGIPVAIYNSAIEMIATAVEGGMQLKNAIAKAMKYIDGEMKGEKWNKGEFAKQANIRFTATLPDGRTVEAERDLTPEAAQVIDGWYHPIEQNILDARQDKMPATQWARLLRSSENEDLWTGVRAFLEEKGNTSVSKQELLDYMKDNRIEVAVVVKKSGLDDQTVLTEEEARQLFDDGKQVYGHYDEGGEALIETEEDFDRFDSFSESGNYNETRYGNRPNLQLEGEREKYREVLVLLPSKRNRIFGKESETLDYAIDTYGKNSEEYRSVKRELENRLEDEYGFSYEQIKEFFTEYEKEPAQFKSTHWDEPNILVHLRMNTRTDAEGKKVLFLEEIQSDWGQKGKNEGFDSEKNDYKSIAERFAKGLGFTQGSEADVKLALKRIKQKSNIWEREYAAFKEAGFSDAEINKMAADYTDGQTPSAPFVTETADWVKLGLKVALQQAVAQGVDKIAWTTGEQQNVRNSLEKAVDKIIVFKDKNGNYSVKGVKGNSNPFYEDNIPENKLSDYIGKELAEKAASEVKHYEEKIYDGEDLKVGGKGMRAFYGSQEEGRLGLVGEVAEKLFGQKVGTVDFSYGKGFRLWNKKTNEFLGSFDGQYINIAEDGTESKVVPENYKTPAQVAAELGMSTADLKIIFTGERVDIGMATAQPAITITPALRSEVEQGLPLFGYSKAANQQKKKAVMEQLGEQTMTGAAADVNMLQQAMRAGAELSGSNEQAMESLEDNGVIQKECE